MRYDVYIYIYVIRRLKVKVQHGQLFVLRELRVYCGGVTEESVLVICDAASVGRRNPHSIMQRQTKGYGNSRLLFVTSRHAPCPV